MEENTRNYIELLDELRREYKIKVEDFCDGICNPRSYRRMLSGERIITHERIFQFCEKLRLSPSDFYYTASRRDRFELKKIYTLYNMIYHHEYSKFLDELKKINRKKLISKQNEKFLDYCVLRYNFVHKKENRDKIIKNLYLLVDYPNCLHKVTYDFVDIVIIMLIAEIQIEHEEYITLDKLLDILNNQNNIIASSETCQIIPSVYSRVCLFLARLNRFDETNKLSKKGITYALAHNDISSLAYLHYTRAHALLKLGFRRESEIEAARCIACAIAKDNPEELRVFFKEIELDHKINPIDLIKRHQESLNIKKAG